MKFHVPRVCYLLVLLFSPRILTLIKKVEYGFRNIFLINPYLLTYFFLCKEIGCHIFIFYYYFKSRRYIMTSISETLGERCSIFLFFCKHCLFRLKELFSFLRSLSYCVCLFRSLGNSHVRLIFNRHANIFCTCVFKII